MISVDEYARGLKPLMNTDKRVQEAGFNRMYEFFTRYVRRIHPDTHWKRAMKNNPNTIWLLLITPSDIAFVISLMKNGMPVWRAKTAEFVSENLTKVKPLFTTGEGQKRSFGKTTWSKEGLMYYLKVERTWHEAYGDKDLMRAFGNGWEKWEPTEDHKKGKELLSTNWTNENNKKSSEQRDDDDHDVLEDGYHSDKYGDVEEFAFELDDENRKKLRSNEESEEDDDEDDDNDKGEGNKGGDIASKEKDERDEPRKRGGRK